MLFLPYIDSVFTNSFLNQVKYFSVILFRIISLANLFFTALRSSPSWFLARLWLLFIYLWTQTARNGGLLTAASLASHWHTRPGTSELGLTVGWVNESTGKDSEARLRPSGSEDLCSCRVFRAQASREDSGFQRSELWSHRTWAWLWFCPVTFELHDRGVNHLYVLNPSFFTCKMDIRLSTLQ